MLGGKDVEYCHGLVGAYGGRHAFVVYMVWEYASPSLTPFVAEFAMSRYNVARYFLGYNYFILSCLLGKLTG